MKPAFNAHAIVDQLAAIYDESVANLRQAVARYVEDRSPPDARARQKGAFAAVPRVHRRRAQQAEDSRTPRSMRRPRRIRDAPAVKG